MIKKSKFWFVILLLITNTSFAQYYRYLNFESAGYVTAVMPAYNNTGNLNGQIVYAKTDIGGVYKGIYNSTNNRFDWRLLKYLRTGIENGLTRSDMIIAGLTVHPTDPNIVFIATGNTFEDAQTVQFNCVWRTTNGGVNFDNPSFPSDPNSKLWFEGDKLRNKVGGECIVFAKYDPAKILLGGINSDTNAAPRLFINDYTVNNNFTVVQEFQAQGHERITCIATLENSNEIWIGTDANYNGTQGGVYRSTDQGASFNRITAFSLQHARRILLKKDVNGYIIAYVAYSGQLPTNVAATDVEGIARFKESNGQWENLTSGFNNNVPLSESYMNDRNNYFSLLTFADAEKNILLAGRYKRPIQKLLNDGNTWIGENNGWFTWDVCLPYNHISTTFPEHQADYELASFIYSGVNSLIRNPNVNLGNNWFVSGGAGLRFSTNVPEPQTGDFMKNSQWEYSTYYENSSSKIGQSMPVVYDVAFDTYTGVPNLTYIPIADWTMAWTTNKGVDFSKLKYDTRMVYYQTTDRLNNASRVLINPDNGSSNSSVTYVIGGDAESYTAEMYERTQIGMNVSKNSRGNAEFFTVPGGNRFICDGIMYKTQPPALTANIMILLVGAYDTKIQPSGNSLGIFRSLDGGQNFTQASATDQSLNPQVSTVYQQSLLPSAYNGFIGDGFNSQFNLTKANDYIYLFLENGGIFRSHYDDGLTWALANSPIPAGQNGEGCLKFAGNNKLVIAINGKGLYVGDIVADGQVNWGSSISNFTTASQVEVNNNNWAVFGKRGSDIYNKLYLSTNGGNNFSVLSNDVVGVRSLRFNPQTTNELWVATSGFGVAVFDNIGTHCIPAITSTYYMTQNDYFDCDIVVGNGGHLIFSNTCTEIKMAEGKKIIVQDGGQIDVQSGTQVTFTKKDDATYWGGIEFVGTGYGTLKQCNILSTYNSSLQIASPISIQSASDAAHNLLSIDGCNIYDGPIKIENRPSVEVKNCNFNYINNYSSVISGINSISSDNVVIDNNILTYNTSLTGSTGISIMYGSNINILNNKIYNTSVGISVSNTSPFVKSNIISCENPSYIANTGIGMDYSYASVLENNNISGYQYGIKLFNSSPALLLNNVQNNLPGYIDIPSALYATENSFPILRPAISDNQVLWNGGQNILKSDGQGDGIFISSSEPATQKGCNTINGLDYYIRGTVGTPSLSYIYHGENNTWGDNPPVESKFYIEEAMKVIYDPWGCYQYTNNKTAIVDRGNGYFDTLTISSLNNNSDPIDLTLFAQGLKQENTSNYASAFNTYSQIIESYNDSITAVKSLKRILYCKDKLNASIAEYSALRNYYQTLSTNNRNDTIFSNVAEELSTKCLVRMKHYTQAITEYENVISSTTDSNKILGAELNIIETYMLLLQGGGDASNFTGRLVSLKPINELDAINRIHLKLYKLDSKKKLNTIPLTFSLSQNYPNPFNPTTKIAYDIPKATKVKIVIYDILGREIQTLVNEVKQAGKYVVDFNGSALASGVYFYRIQSNDFVSVKRMALIK